MKHHRSVLVALISTIGIVSAQSLSSKSLFARVNDPVAKAVEAYASVYDGFYGVGKARTLLKASLDERPDGTPNISLDRSTGTAEFTIRLMVNEPAYEAWKTEAHRLMDGIGTASSHSDPRKERNEFCVGGTIYLLDDIMRDAINRWEENGENIKKASLLVRVELLDAEQKSVRSVMLPIDKFKRKGFDKYPLPLFHLNRLRDLKGDNWFNLRSLYQTVHGAVLRADETTQIQFCQGIPSLANIDATFNEIGICQAAERAVALKIVPESIKEMLSDDSFATVPLSGLTESLMNVVVDVRCTILDEESLAEEREGALRVAREREEAEKRKGPIAGLIATMAPIPDRPYLIGRYEVTQAQWNAVMGIDSHGNSETDLPVVSVSWVDCQRFLRKLNALPETKEARLIFRLPTDDEWRHACRAGAGGTSGFCKLVNETIADKDDLDKIAWFGDNGNSMLHPVGQKLPNAFGLFDMIGNVGEWTSTRLGPGATDIGVPGQWILNERPQARILGGSYTESADSMLQHWAGRASRSTLFTYSSHNRVGFRLCAEACSGSSMIPGSVHAGLESILESMVSIPGKSFKIGRTEVTQAQWESVMGENPSVFQGADRPVENVSWVECQVFLNRLNNLSAVRESGLLFRLPTVAEWMYSCRAGSKSGFCRLADGTDVYDDYERFCQTAWMEEHDKDQPNHPVGQKLANAFGLYDMYGNVWEWTQTEEECLGIAICGRSCLSRLPYHREEMQNLIRFVDWVRSYTRDERLGFRLCVEKEDVVRSCEQSKQETLERVLAEIVSSMRSIPGQNYTMGKTEVTVRQWESIMGERGLQGNPDDPVAFVSLFDCQSFLDRLNAFPAVKTAGLVFRLPTRQEWDYACLANAEGDYCKLADGTDINWDLLEMVAWSEKNSGGNVHPVGQFEPNAYGLYDMLGNVREWTSTSYRSDLYMVLGGSYRGCRPVRGFGHFDYMGEPLSCHVSEVGFRLCADSEGKIVPTVVDSTVAGVSMVGKPRLGVSIHPFEGAKHAEWPSGLIIEGVEESSPAARAGLRVGDVILEANENRTTANGDLTAILARLKESDAVNLKIWRPDVVRNAGTEQMAIGNSGKNMDVQVILAVLDPVAQ